MKINSSISLGLVATVLACALVAPLGAYAASSAPAPAAPAEKTGKLIRVTEKEATWAAAARKDYPLQVCVTSDEKLGSMGKSPEYAYRVDGKPDRLVVFCCEGCEEDFLKEPAKYLAKIDAAKAAAAKTKSAAPGSR